MESISLKDLLSVLRRRRTLFFAVAGLIFLLTIVIAVKLSNYRSTAMVEVATPEVSEGTAVPAGMTLNEYNESLVDLRISRLQQRVLSTTSLIEVIAKFDLYPRARKSTPIADLADKMQNKVKVELVGGTLATPSSAQKASARDLSAIAFTLSFDYSDPLVAQQVTNELVTRFLDEDLKERRKIAHETSAFLDSQIKTLEKALEEQEKNIADFRAANGDIHPESLGFNQQAHQSVMFTVQNLDTQLATNEANIGALQAQLATMDPYSRVIADGQVLTTPTVQLKALKTQYSTLTAQYGSDHPDVIKLSRQIAALKKQVGASADSMDTGEIISQITDTETNLAAAKKTYGPKHPDVLALEKKLEKLKEDLEKNKGKPADTKLDADNPAYLQAAASLKTAQEQRKALLRQKDELLEQQKKYQRALESNPVTEQKLAGISRDYENAQMRYRELKAKKMAADMSETIELDRSGQRLEIISPPELPLHTHPSRTLILAIGLVLSFIGGMGSVAMAQALGQGVMGAHHLESLVGVAPLVIVPHIFNREEIRENKRLLKRNLGIVAGVLFCGIIWFSYAIMPLDVLWSVIGQKLGLW